MSILDEVASDQGRWRRGDCYTCAWILGRPEEEQEEWLAAMKDGSFSHTSIRRAMQRRDADAPGESSVSGHRRNRHWEREIHEPSD